MSEVPLLLALSCLVTGVRADSSLTALIVSSCISGLLILLVILGGIIYCVIRYQRKQEYLQKTSEPFSNGHYHPMGMGEPRLSPGGWRAKAYTQHPPPPRHRPPLTFYTLRADPRDVGLTPPPPQAFPMGGAFVTAPPNFGRPVLYLDMLDTVAGPKRNGAAMPGNANGNADGHARGAEDDEQEHSDERYRRKEQKSRGRSKSRSRGESTPSHPDRSRSRSRDATSANRKPGKSQQPLEETPILALPGDIILSDGNLTRDGLPTVHDAMRRSFSQPRLEDAAGGFTTTTLQQRNYTLTFDNEMDQEYDDLQRSDIYFLPSSRSEDPFETSALETHPTDPPVRPANSLHFIPVSDFALRRPVADLGQDHEPTPRADYLEASAMPPGALLPAAMRQVSESDSEPVPAPDYSARAVVSSETQAFSFQEVRQTYPSPALAAEERDGQAFDTLLTSVNHHSSAALRQRPPTPPFDGEISPRDSLTFAPPRPPTLGQLDSGDVRIPTPPPDIPSPVDEEDDDVDAGGRFAAMLATRPPTPPPGKLLRPKEEELDILQDLQEEGIRGKQQKTSSMTNLPTLPFMAELRRRQRDPQDSDDDDDDDDDPTHPLHPTALPALSQQEKGANSSRALDAVLSLDPQTASRAQVVSFTADPPEIIPHPDHPHSPTTPSQLSTTSAFASPPPPPPPPPPPLPPPPPPPPPPFMS